ncbi:MAG: hypothetical protein AAGG48_31415 [Planctomycetota bacterium]
MKRLVTWTAILVVILFGTGYLISLYLLHSARGTVTTMHEQITDSGDKLYLSDYADDLIADEDNAFHQLFDDGSNVSAFDEAYFALAPPDSLQGWTPDAKPALPDAALEKLVADHQSLFDRFEKASRCKSYWADIDYSLGLSAPLAYLPQLRSISRSIAAKARIMAASGDGDEALRTCSTGLRIHRLLESEPNLVTQLANMAGEQMILNAAHFTLMNSNPSESVRAEFDQALSQLDVNRAMLNGLKGERAMSLMTFAQIRNGEFDPGNEIPTSGFMGGTTLGSAYLYNDEATYIRMMNTQIEMVTKPFAERDPILDGMEAELSDSGFRNTVTKLLFPSIRRTIDAKDDMETNIRCMRIVVTAYGQSSLDLESVPAAVRIDPYSQQDFLVKPTDTGWIIYGVGRNLMDDGGKIYEVQGSNGLPTDIGFPSAPPK